MSQSNESVEKKSKEAIDQVLPSQEPPLLSNIDDGELLAPKVRAAAERRLVNILDARLLPTIVLIFIMNYIDVSSAVPLSRLFRDAREWSRQGSNIVGLDLIPFN